MKKVELNKRLYTVIEKEKYAKDRSLYNPRLTAIEVRGGDYVLPFNSRPSDTEPGVYWYENGMVAVVNKPENPEDYSSERIIDYTKAKDVGDLIRNNEIIRDIQNDIMTTSDNILKLNISDKCTPAMKGLKQAINIKGVDKKQYEDKFEQFQNDMRLLKGDSITLAKLESIGTAFDIDILLTLRDKDGAPNPMGEEIVINLSEGDVGGEE